MKFYQKTPFLFVAGVTIFIAGFAAGTPGYFEAEEVTKDSEQESVESTPVPVDLTTGIWTCGVDIAPGRYVATVPEGGASGNFYIEDTDGKLYVAETLGHDEFSVPSVTFTIEEGDTIEIKFTPVVHFEPVG